MPTTLPPPRHRNRDKSAPGDPLLQIALVASALILAFMVLERQYRYPTAQPEPSVRDQTMAQNPPDRRGVTRLSN